MRLVVYATPELTSDGRLLRHGGGPGGVATLLNLHYVIDNGVARLNVIHVVTTALAKPLGGLLAAYGAGQLSTAGGAARRHRFGR